MDSSNWRGFTLTATVLFPQVNTNGMTNTVCTNYELVNGDTSAGEGTTYNMLHLHNSHKSITYNCVSAFHGLDEDMLRKALRSLEIQKKAEIMSFDGNEGVKFF